MAHRLLLLHLLAFARFDAVFEHCLIGATGQPQVDSKLVQRAYHTKQAIAYFSDGLMVCCCLAYSL